MMRRSSGSRVWLLIVVLFIVAGTAAYFVGAKVENTARQDEVVSVRSALQDAQNEVETLQSVNQLLNANVWAYRAAYALDNRNFGVANDDVVKTVVNLRSVKAESAGVDRKALSALQQEAGNV